jgi:hypothetical protein
MGSSRQRHSTRAPKAHPPQKPRQTPPARKQFVIPLRTLKEMRERLVTARSVVMACARALETFSGTDDVQITLHNDVVAQLDALALVTKHIIIGQPFPFPWRAKP